MTFIAPFQKAIAAFVSALVVAGLFQFGVEGVEGEIETVVEALVAAGAVYLIPNKPSPA